MNQVKFLGLVFVLSFSSLYAQNTFKLGEPVPPLDFLKILNNEKTSGKLSDFQSKVVILDFWATWCAPCIESLPHLEELQKKFSRDITVLAITDESVERIEKFLQKKNLSLPVVIDIKGELASKFPHRSIPHTIVIDKNRMVKAITTPKELSEEVIKKIVGNYPVNITEKKDNMSFDPSKPLSGNENFTYQVTVTPYQEGLPSMSNPTGGNGAYKNRRILGTNLSPKTLYEVAYQFPAGIRTVVEVKNKAAFDWSKQTAICFDLIVPDEWGEKRFEIMKEHLGWLLPFKPVIEKRQMKVKVLKAIDGQRPAIQPSTGGQKEVADGGRGLSMKNAELTVIAEFLESQLNIPVANEIGLTGLFNLELNWYNEDPEQIHNELRKIGLELVDGTKSVDALVIYDKEK